MCNILYMCIGVSVDGCETADTYWAVWWYRWGWRWWLQVPNQLLPRPQQWCNLRFDRTDTPSLWWPTCWTMEGSPSLTQLQVPHTPLALNILGTVDPDGRSCLCRVKRREKSYYMLLITWELAVTSYNYWHLEPKWPIICLFWPKSNKWLD